MWHFLRIVYRFIIVRVCACVNAHYEIWILTPTLMTKLEKFQAEIGRGLLGISRYHADLAPLIGLHLPSMMARVFIRKLSFLAKLLTSNEDTQSSRTFRTCAADNVYNISLIQQCQWLQCTLNIEQILQQCLENPDSAVLIVKSARNSILRRDWANTVHLAKSHMSLKHIVSSNDIASGWCRIWDSALDQGYRGTKLSQCLFRSLCHPLLVIASASIVMPTFHLTWLTSNTYASHI